MADLGALRTVPAVAQGVGARKSSKSRIPVLGARSTAVDPAAPSSHPAPQQTSADSAAPANASAQRPVLPSASSRKRLSVSESDLTDVQPETPPSVPPLIRHQSELTELEKARRDLLLQSALPPAAQVESYKAQISTLMSKERLGSPAFTSLIDKLRTRGPPKIAIHPPSAETEASADADLPNFASQSSLSSSTESMGSRRSTLLVSSMEAEPEVPVVLRRARTWRHQQPPSRPTSVVLSGRGGVRRSVSATTAPVVGTTTFV
eukprot:m.871074 g.871074  ORF g.871074 m.871074 type:complete len:263 (-) comp59759_c0_seq13:319-1107(-)